MIAGLRAGQHFTPSVHEIFKTNQSKPDADL